MATIAFFPEGAYGPTNNCAGIGAVLRARGHRVCFIVEESFAGTLEARGFEERLVRLGPPPAQEQAPGQFWKDFVRDTAPVFRLPTVEQLEQFIAPTFKALADGARYVDDQLGDILGELHADAVVEDNVVAFPALASSGVPWIRIASCNPAEIKDEFVPPAFSGYPTEDSAGWGDYWEEYRRVIGPLSREHDEFCRARGAQPLPDPEMIAVSPWLNIYVYPRELDYARATPMPGRWVRLESCVRDEQEDWAPPEGDGPLVYLSLGSLGSADVELMQRLIDSLEPLRELRVVASLGPQHELLKVPRALQRRRIPAPDRGPAPRRRRDHPRRQQHGHGEHPLRLPNGGAAHLLGSARQRPAGGRVQLRDSPRHIRSRARPVGRGAPSAARGARASRAGWRRSPGACRSRPEPCGPRRRSSAWHPGRSPRQRPRRALREARVREHSLKHR